MINKYIALLWHKRVIYQSVLIFFFYKLQSFFLPLVQVKELIRIHSSKA